MWKNKVQFFHTSLQNAWGRFAPFPQASPPSIHKQQNRTFHLLQKPDISICYRHSFGKVPQPPRNGGAKLFIRAPRTFSFNSRNTQHSQSLGDVGAMGVWMNVFVHIENAAILPDVKSPAVRKSCGTQHPVRPCNPFIRIAQNGIVEPERLSEWAVGASRIYPHAEALCFEAPE